MDSTNEIHIQEKIKELATAVVNGYNVLTSSGDIDQDNLNEPIHEQIDNNLIWNQDIAELAIEGLINITIENAAITVTDVDELFTEVYSVALQLLGEKA